MPASRSNQIITRRSGFVGHSKALGMSAAIAGGVGFIVTGAVVAPSQTAILCLAGSTALAAASCMSTPHVIHDESETYDVTEGGKYATIEDLSDNAIPVDLLSSEIVTVD